LSNQSIINSENPDAVSSYEDLKNIFENYKKNPKNLDMSRGKPSDAQMDLSIELLTILNESDYISEENVDCRNYGNNDGLIEMKKIFADMLNVKTENIIVFGNSTLSALFDLIGISFIKGVNGGTPWNKLSEIDEIKFLCLTPGYDRHFAICEFFNIKMISVPMNENGPDMDLIEDLISADESIKGIWCVPKYSNPTGITYSDETVRRFANLKPKACDFRIFWDNAYAHHKLYDTDECLSDILSECEKAGNPNLVYEFTSFSKISFGGGGVVALATSTENVKYILDRISIQTIGPDKINQLRHVKFFKNADGVKKHLENHSKLLRPKFELLINKFEKEFSDNKICSWTNPKGGYFITLTTADNQASKVIDYCKQCGLVLTSAGAPFPYGNDPKNNIIRLAPSFPSLEELTDAMEIFCLCVKLVYAENFKI